MPIEPTDIELIREVLAGDVDRFELLVRRYQRLVATAALRMGIPAHEVGDVANEVFYKVYRNLSRYAPEHALSTWLYRITVNTALDHRRSRRHEARMEEIQQTMAADGPSAQERVDAGERVRLLQNALSRIPEHYRTPLVLAHIEELPLEEIARVLQLPEGTIKSRLFRGRALLKDMIEKHYPALAPGGAEAVP